MESQKISQQIANGWIKDRKRTNERFFETIWWAFILRFSNGSNYLSSVVSHKKKMYFGVKKVNYLLIDS